MLPTLFLKNEPLRRKGREGKTKEEGNVARISF